MSDQGYPNQGPDPRILGQPGAAMQRRLSFKSPTEPEYRLWSSADGRWQFMLARSVPRNLPYVSLAWPNPFRPGRIATFRAGWRYDKYWGDKTPCGECDACQDQRPWDCADPILETDPMKIGGYIADVIIKTRQTQVVHY